MTKKTETVEVRMSPDLKLELSELSKQRQQPMSQVIRQLVEQELSSASLQDEPTGDKVMSKKLNSRVLRWGGSGTALLALALMWNVTVQNTASADATIRVTFAAMDLNEDGEISRKEFERFSTEGIDLALLSSDETESVAETAAFPEIPQACKAEFEELGAEGKAAFVEEFSLMDQDKNGSISFEELRRDMKRQYREMFIELDKNIDGYLVAEEFEASLTAPDPFFSEACEKALMAVEDTEVMQEVRYAVAHFDENNDRKISLDEFLNNQSDSIF